MRRAAVLVERVPDQGAAGTAGGRLGPAVRVVARDWPHAAWLAVPLLAAGAALGAFAAAGRHAAEGGGAVVFLAVGAFAAWLSLARRRDVVVLRDAEGVRVRGREGAGPAARPLDLALPAETEVRVEPFPVPEGAPDLPDRGGDLLLAGGGVRLLLARRTGPGWREELGAAALAVGEALVRPGAVGPAAPVHVDGPRSSA